MKKNEAVIVRKTANGGYIVHVWDLPKGIETPFEEIPFDKMMAFSGRGEKFQSKSLLGFLYNHFSDREEDGAV